MNRSCTNAMNNTKRILLIISGGIAAYKTLVLIRLLKETNFSVHCVLTEAATKFVTPLAVGALSGNNVHTDLFALDNEQNMGHIRLSRESDLIVVAPASADLIAKAACGLANDLASTILLATNKPVLVAPSMNKEMWEHSATKRNLKRLEEDGIHTVGPNSGNLACGEIGEGRMAEPEDIMAAIETLTITKTKSLSSIRSLVTSGPTIEPIDPVRYLGNHSSGKQGHAIADALSKLGSDVTLVTGPTNEPDPLNAKVIHIQTAEQMLAACIKSLPVDVVVCAAAVSDWRVAAVADQKIKRRAHPNRLELVQNPDILAHLSMDNVSRPTLVVGFAAETEAVIDNAKRKLTTKGCDWIIANDVSKTTEAFGGTNNAVHIIDKNQCESWPHTSKVKIAERLALRIASQLDDQKLIS